MLSDKEKQLLTEFLQTMPTFDLFSLAFTVSGGSLKTTSVEEALRGIIQHTDNLQYILDRKIVKKQYIYNYLHERQVPLQSSGTDKNYLMRKLLETWTQVMQDSTVVSSTNTDHYLLEFSCSFIQWFYNLINDSDPNRLSPEHFFSNCNIKLTIKASETLYNSEVSGSIECVNLINGIRNRYSCKFAPYVPGGLKFKEDDHGLVLIQAKGSLHNGADANGIFEQVFMLLRDPAANNNWKIKSTEINIGIQHNPYEKSIEYYTSS